MTPRETEANHSKTGLKVLITFRLLQKMKSDRIKRLKYHKRSEFELFISCSNEQLRIKSEPSSLNSNDSRD